jgi:hypothetical protein
VRCGRMPLGRQPGLQEAALSPKRSESMAIAEQDLKAQDHRPQGEVFRRQTQQ